MAMAEAWLVMPHSSEPPPNSVMVAPLLPLASILAVFVLTPPLAALTPPLAVLPPLAAASSPALILGRYLSSASPASSGRTRADRPSRKSWRGTMCTTNSRERAQSPHAPQTTRHDHSVWADTTTPPRRALALPPSRTSALGRRVVGHRSHVPYPAWHHSTLLVSRPVSRPMSRPLTRPSTHPLASSA